MPPCLGPAADAIWQAGSNNNAAAASVRTLRMVSPPGVSVSKWPIATDDTMMGLPGNRLSPCRHWQFGLSKACATELVADFYRYLHGNRPVRCRVATAMHTKGSRHNASPGARTALPGALA